MSATERHAVALVAELRKWKARAENAEAERDELQATVDRLREQMAEMVHQNSRSLKR